MLIMSAAYDGAFLTRADCMKLAVMDFEVEEVICRQRSLVGDLVVDAAVPPKSIVGLNSSFWSCAFVMVSFDGSLGGCHL